MSDNDKAVELLQKLYDQDNDGILALCPDVIIGKPVWLIVDILGDLKQGDWEGKGDTPLEAVVDARKNLIKKQRLFENDELVTG